MFSLFEKKQILDEDSVQWMLDCYEWALRNLDASVFYNETRLVYPNNDFFPGEENSPAAKSQLILEQVKKHAQMDQWPVRLVDEDTYLDSSFVASAPRLMIEGNVRGSNALAPKLDIAENALFILYQPGLLSNPQALIANYSQMLANYLAHTAKEAPPGGSDNWPALTEMIAVYLGFGLMYANTSGNVRITSCGSCQAPVANRVNYLSQFDATYALAIFVLLKNIDPREVKPYLKKTLHTFFKKALAELRLRENDMARLRSYGK